MKWFKHDSDAYRDPKLEKVLMRYGAEGYALYWLCLELIAAPIDAKTVTFELEHDAEILAYRLKMDSARVEEIMRYFVSLALFEMNATSNRVTCLKLAQRIENSIVKNPEISKIRANLVPEDPGRSRMIPDNSGKLRTDTDTDTDTEKEITTLSGKARRIAPQKNSKKDDLEAAQRILDFLNEKTGRKYQPVKSNLRLIVARLRESDEQTCRQVIAKKTREWRGTDREEYLRPATLFGALKFAQYQGELV